MTERLDLRNLELTPGESTHVTRTVHIDPYRQAGQAYPPDADEIPAEVDIDAMLQGHSFRLRFETTMEGPCSRCLEPARVHFRIDSREIHDPRADDPELVSDFVHERELDIDAWAQDAIGLEFPTRVLCSEDCAGLCPVCGTNKNEGECACVVDVTDSRWDKLKDLRLDE